MSDAGFVLFGLGGAGGKVVNTVAAQHNGEIKAIAIDTDFDAVSRLGNCEQHRIGKTRFDGTGSGGDKSGAGMATDEASDLVNIFENVQVAVIVAGIGKGTGSGMLPKMLAKAAERNVATLVFMIVPFQFEGVELSRRAAETEQSVSKLGDIRIICRNDDLCAFSPEATLEESFNRATLSLAEGITLIWKMTTMPGYINLDSATLVNIIRSGRGLCNLGVGIASGPQRTQMAAEALLANRGLGLGSKLTGAKAALVGIIGGEDLRLKEISDTMAAIGSALSMDTEIRMATVLDKTVMNSLHVVVLLFRDWTPLYGHDDDLDVPEAETTDAASSPPKQGSRYTALSPKSSTKRPGTKKTYTERFQDSAATCRNGENLDKPTYLRRRLHIDLS